MTEIERVDCPRGECGPLSASTRRFQQETRTHGPSRGLGRLQTVFLQKNHSVEYNVT